MKKITLFIAFIVTPLVTSAQSFFDTLEDIDGVDSILVGGKWKEAGDTGFPWEDDANNGNDNGNI